MLIVAGCGVSVQHRQVGPHAFYIEAEGKHASEDDALAAVHQRAGELCPDGYGLVTTTSSASRVYMGGSHWRNDSHAALTVECIAATASRFPDRR